MFIQSLDGGKPQPVQTDRYLTTARISPDQCSIAGLDMDAKISIVPVAGGPAKRLDLRFIGEPVRWSADGTSLLVQRLGGVPAELFSVDIKSGRYTTWQSLAPSDVTGVLAVAPAYVSSDLQSYAYSFNRTLSVLFTVSGLN